VALEIFFLRFTVTYLLTGKPEDHGPMFAAICCRVVAQGVAMEKDKGEQILRLVTSRETGKNERILNYATSRDNFNMWGKIAVDETGWNVGGWLVGSRSVGAAPYWIPTMHYYSREDGKFYFVRPNIALAKMDLIVDQEDTDLDPERAKFILENIDTWERESNRGAG
jgi:hypothetical protein